MCYPYNNIRFEKQSNMVCIELLISTCYYDMGQYWTVFVQKNLVLRV